MKGLNSVNEVVEFEVVRNMLSEILGIEDLDEINPDSDLVNDLAAESIDFIDICFRLEKDYKLGKVSVTDVFPETSLVRKLNEASGDQQVEILENLEKSMPHVKELVNEYKDTKNPRVFLKVKNIYDFINYKLSGVVS